MGRPADRSRARIVAAVTAAALVVLGGSVAAWATLANREDTPAVAVAPTPALPPTFADPGPSPSPSVVPTTPAVVDDPVTLTAAASAQPYAAQVRGLIARHFAAINARDYDAWLGTVSTARAQDQTRDTWVRGYSSSHDTDITITAIEPDGATAAIVRVAFTSTQRPEDAPPDLRVGRICWTQQLPVTSLDADPRVGLPPKGSSTKTAC